MAERLFYSDKFEFEGSMDDSNCFYDKNHRLLGHVEGGTIYDNSNIPRGHIDSEGRITDMCNLPTGKDFGSNFVGWGGHSNGLVRNDVLGTGCGNDYGAFSLVKNANRPYSMAGDDDGDDDDDDYHGGSKDYRPSSNGGHHGNDSIDTEGCGCGCIVIIVVVLALSWLLS